LMAMGQDLIKERNILFAAFLNEHGNLVAYASRDPDFNGSSFSSSPRDLLQTRHLSSPVLGQYVQSIEPVIDSTASTAVPSRLLGYVAVGVSESQEQATLRRATFTTIGMSLLIVAASLPMAVVLIHRIFLPIRDLVAATKRIAAGEFGVQVATHRNDIIGDLARSFNEMATVVQWQQQELQLANEQLEQKVVQRTAELETANQRLTREIAEKEDFLRAVSHDLNAPLRNIAGMANMLLLKHSATLNEDVIHRLDRIKKNVEIETDLISELLELSRIKTRRHKLEPVNSREMVQELGGLFEGDLSNHGIALLIDTPLPLLNCERMRLRQVFQNLVDNAIKYMGTGDRREIHVGCAMGPNGAEFYVRDTGIGIDPEDLDKVFFVFRRGKNTQSQNIAGKGVGLASVKSIIETYKGTISVESALGEGSTFRFSIAREFVIEHPQAAAA